MIIPYNGEPYTALLNFLDKLETLGLLYKDLPKTDKGTIIKVHNNFFKIVKAHLKADLFVKRWDSPSPKFNGQRFFYSKKVKVGSREKKFT